MDIYLARFTRHPRIELSVKTSRPLDAAFVLGEDARLTQLISRIDELHQLNVSGGTYRPTVVSRPSECHGYISGF
jgi:hypothetical protein